MIRRLLPLLAFMTFPSWGAIDGTLTCVSDDAGAVTTETVDGTDGWSAAANSVVFGLVCVDGNGSSQALTDTDGLSVIQFYDSTSIEHKGWLGWVADPSGTKSSWSPVLANAPNDFSVTLCRVPDTDLDTSAIDASGENETLVATDPSTTIASGDATNTAADALVFAGACVEQSNDWDPTTYASGSADTHTPDTTNSRALPRVSTQVVSATGAQNESISTTDTGSSGWGFNAILATGDTITYDADNYALGATITMTPSGFASGAITTITEQAGSDSLSVTSNQATACALADLVSTGNCNNTQLATSLTWRASNGTETADDTFTLDMPTGAEFSTTTSIDCTAGTDCPGDSVLVSPATTGDDAIFHFTSGSGTCNASGVCSTTTSTADVDVYVFDDSARAWLAKRTVEVTEPTGSGGSECAKVASGVIGQVIEQIKDLATCVAR